MKIDLLLGSITKIIISFTVIDAFMRDWSHSRK